MRRSATSATVSLSEGLINASIVGDVAVDRDGVANQAGDLRNHGRKLFRAPPHQDDRVILREA
ncbi:MAG: hypothetical protein V2I24_03680 [Halieaceae bacterium]|nr:hypothetical protein [Halieaceae bacterium]